MKYILLNTILKEYRSKTLILFSILTMIILLLANSLLGLVKESFDGAFSPETMGETSIGIFLWMIGLWGHFLSIYIGSRLLPTDIDGKITHFLLSLPLRPFDYLVGRLLGGVSIVYFFYGLSILLASLLFSLTLKIPLFSFAALGAIFSMGFTSLALISLSMTFSLFLGRMGSFITMVFLLFGIWISRFSEPIIWENFTSGAIFEWQGIWNIIKTFAFLLLPHLDVWEAWNRHLLLNGEFNFSLGLESVHILMVLGLWFLLLLKIFPARVRS